MTLMSMYRRSIAMRLLAMMLTVVCLAAYGQVAPNAQQAANRADFPGTANAMSPPAGQPSYPAAAASKEYRIGVNDVLTINVWHEPDLSRNLTVRPDGKISLPLVGDVRAAGKTPLALQAELSSDLARYIKDPELTVIVAEIRSRRVNIIGQVMHPGAFALTQQMGVLDIIAEAGGLREFAKKNKIYVLREISAGVHKRLKYNYKAVLDAKSGAHDILLQANDTVVVP